MANKRVPELSPITAPELATNDLFLLSDVSAVESKRLAVSELQSYIQTHITASSTGSYASLARSASYIIYNGTPNGTASYAISASHALWADTSSYAITASFALLANTASYSITSSYAITASYCFTSSVQLTYSSAYSDFAKSASYVIYNGGDNGTVYQSVYSELATYATSSGNSGTTNYLLYTGTPNGTASVALTASLAYSASYLIYNAGISNGTASYAALASSSNYLNYNSSVSNGTASNAFTASNAITSSNSITASYALTASYATQVPGIFQMYGPFSPSLVNANVGAVSISITSSFANPNLIFEFNGDHGVPFVLNPASDGKITVNAVSPSFPSSTILVAQAWAHAPLANSSQMTGSITQSFYIRSGQNNSFNAGVKYNFTLTASNCTFQNTYNPLTMWILSKEVSGINVA